MGFAKKSGAKDAVAKAIASRVLPKYDPYAIPQMDIDAQANAQRDFTRRLAKRASGRDSTIRTSAAGALYKAQPNQLLGS